jgi:hypothetical protein
MTDSKWVLVLGAVITLVGLSMSSFPFALELRSGSGNTRTAVVGLVVLVVGASLLVVALMVSRRGE